MVNTPPLTVPGNLQQSWIWLIQMNTQATVLREQEDPYFQMLKKDMMDYGRWKSESTADGYVQKSKKKKTEIANNIASGSALVNRAKELQNALSLTNSNLSVSTSNSASSTSSTKVLHFNHCNVTLNIS